MIDDLADRTTTNYKHLRSQLTFLEDNIFFFSVVAGTEVIEIFIVSYITDDISLHFERVYYFILVVLWFLLHVFLVVRTLFQWF
jgi:hypothetical protein